MTHLNGLKREMDEIKALEKVRGSGTSLISYYISSGSAIGSCTSMITKELGTASNIKSKSTRKDVLSALRSIGHYLKTLRKIPDNGLAIFSSKESFV